MRYIDNTRLSPTQAWLDLAIAALAALTNSADRSAFLSDKETFEAINPETDENATFVASDVWKMLRIELLNLIFEGIANDEEPPLKCWYHETILDAEYFVDHFRPKGTVKAFTNKNADIGDINVWQQLNCATREGYWFLTFDFTNFRIASKLANELRNPVPEPSKAKGKSSFFPLHRDSISASNVDDLDAENIALIDPCNIQEVELLRFDNLGEAKPTNLPNRIWLYCKAIVSIQIYALNHHSNIIKKRKKLWDVVEKVIKTLHDSWYRKLGIGILKPKNFDAEIDEIKSLTKKQSEYSAVAIDCIRHWKRMPKYEWLNKHFPDVDLVK